MKVVLTLLARNEADVIDANLAFHLNAGVDFVVATDHRSSDATTEIFQRYARDGCLHLIREEGEEYTESGFVTRMARMAAVDFGADWVINSAADEFWWPRGANLKDVLAAVPSRYGQVKAVIRNFVPRPAPPNQFYERMTVRLALQAPINDPSSTYRSYSKMIHRGDSGVVVGRGAHTVKLSTALIPLRAWCPVEVLHFGLRSREQYAAKAVVMHQVFSHPESEVGTAYHERAFRMVSEGRGEEGYEDLVVTDDEVARGLADGLLVTDTRVRDALRHLLRGDGRFCGPREAPVPIAAPTVLDDAAYAVEIAVLAEADNARLRRELDELERRVSRLELPLAKRAMRAVRRRVSRSRHRQT